MGVYGAAGYVENVRGNQLTKRFVKQYGTNKKVAIDLNPQLKAVIGQNVYLADGVTLLDLSTFQSANTDATVTVTTPSGTTTTSKVLGRVPLNGSITPSNIAYNLPLLFKGDLLAFGTYSTRLPVGADGTTLIADHTQTLGVRWGAAGGGNLVGAPIWPTFNSGVFNGTSVNYVGDTLFVLLPATEILTAANTWTVDLQAFISGGGAGTASIKLALYRCARGTNVIHDVIPIAIGATSNPTITFASGVWNGTLDAIAQAIDPTYDHYFAIYFVSISAGQLNLPTQSTGRWANSNGIPTAGGAGFAYASGYVATDYTTLVAGNSIPPVTGPGGGAAMLSFARVLS